ncbi:MAG TPA: hypothetical protein VFA21_03900 [Pyrinomonadaceae bacterium]|nr:hypothetical protein [Pyrinomonadaceae bacterium]
MRSSTSSSEAEVLRADWPRTLTATALLVLLLLGGWEVFWRTRGFEPSVSDDARLWSAARHRVRPDSVVLVGSSRMHAGVHPSDFQQATGILPVQLAVNGGMSYPVLENLARDQSFRGTVICDLSEAEVTTGMTTYLETGFVNSYEHETLAGRAESRLQMFAQAHLVLASPQLSPPLLEAAALQGRLPAPATSPATVGEDRTLYLDFTKADLEKLRPKIADMTVAQGPDISPEEFVARARRFVSLAEKIEARGGRVVFVRFPTSELLWERLEKAYPKASYWDEFARRTHVQTVHFKDYPELQFDCPDYVHLDMRDAPRFTSALAKIVFAKR